MAEKEETLVQWKPLKEFTKSVFVAVGLPPNDAEAVADVLVWANLRGIDSHGVLRIAQYVRNVETGFMNPKPDIQVLNETPATLLIEADHAFGPVVTNFAMNRAIEKARKVGIGWALIRNTTHQGTLGYYTLAAVKEGMVGISSVASPANMAYYGAKGAGLSPNPIAISVPAKRHRPLLLDMSTAMATFGRIYLAVDRGETLPEGWALDKDGNPTTDPKQAVITMPFGGPKGSGLALMLECLNSVLAGNPRLEPMLMDKTLKLPNLQNSFVAAIDIGTFTDVEEFKQHIDNLIDGIKSLPKADGVSEIFMPGEPENRKHEERTRNGIPLPEGTVRNLREIAGKFDINLAVGL